MVSADSVAVPVPVTREPNETLYVHNLNEKIKKNPLKKSLHSVFSQFGKIVDIVALRGFKLRGQAWVVFESKAAATNALRTMQNFPFYDKPLVIEFAKHRSDILAKKDAGYVPREKRKRAEAGAQPAAKAAPTTQAGPATGQNAGANTATADTPAAMHGDGVHSGDKIIELPEGAEEALNPPNSILFATRLPAECTQVTLSPLFQQYNGLREVRMVPGNAGLAFIEFGDEMQATMALQSLNGFKLTPTDTLHLNYAKK